MQALAEIVAEQRRELVDGKARKRRLALVLEIAGEFATEIALDQRPSQRTQMVAPGADPVDGPIEMGISWKLVRTVEAQKNLVGEAERQHRGSRDLGGQLRRKARHAC